MIPNMIDAVFGDVVKRDTNVVNVTNDEKLAEFFGSPKSTTEDDADEVVVLENMKVLENSDGH